MAGDQPEREHVDADRDQRGDALRGQQHLVPHQRRGHLGQIYRVRRDNAADAQRAEHRQHHHAPEIRDIGERPDADTAEQCGEQDCRTAAVAVGDPAHQVDAQQNAGADLQRLDHGVLVDVDDVVRAPDERIKPRADAVGVEDDEAPGDSTRMASCHCTRSAAGDRCAQRCDREWPSQMGARFVDAASEVDVDIVSPLRILLMAGLRAPSRRLGNRQRDNSPEGAADEDVLDGGRPRLRTSTAGCPRSARLISPRLTASGAVLSAGPPDPRPAQYER